jgi:ElaB/YqjD/DUF883 family membrane-anchored ribosome-binding protein
MATEKKPAAAKTAATKPAAPKKPAAKPAAKSEAKPAASAAAKKTAVPATGVAKIKADPGKTDAGVKANLKDEFNSFKDQAGEKARDAANRGKERAAEAMGGIGKIIRDSAETIDEKVGKQYGDYARTAADAVDGFADKVDAKDVDTLVEDARQFIRKSPAVAIGAAAAIGFILARVIRSGRDG